jgi:hypothetical protein
MLVLLMGEIYKVCRRNYLRWHDTLHTKIHYDSFRHSSNVKVMASTIWETAKLILLMGGIH